jgi:ElaB/YqjD/DUF883 family membrane-anchored ribosome-binding protein
MNKKQIKKVVKKNVKIAKAKGSELKAIAKKGYNQLKKDINISPADAKKLEARAIKEYEKVKKQMEVTAKKAENYIKKNPAKAAAISAGIGAALASAAALMITYADKKSGKNKK